MQKNSEKRKIGCLVQLCLRLYFTTMGLISFIHWDDFIILANIHSLINT